MTKLLEINNKMKQIKVDKLLRMRAHQLIVAKGGSETWPGEPD